MPDTVLRRKPAGRRFLPAVVSAIRVHQWVKNLLVFAAPVLAHRIDASTVFGAFQAFAALCLASSATYVVNDLCDIDSDRAHPTKRNRAFASEALPRRIGWVLAASMAVGALILALWATPSLALWVLTYCGVTIAYSVYLKRVLALDVVLLAGLYAARLVAGGIATGIPISPPALAFSVFFFFSIALMKRCAELYNRRASGAVVEVPGRPYRIEDLHILSSIGAASAVISVFVIAVYVNGDDVRRLYRNPDMLWLLCMILLLWISRMWIIAHRGAMDEDPVLFALRDRWSLLTVLAGIAVFVAAV